MIDDHPIHHEPPAQFLVDNIGLLPKGRVLDLAMGRGRNSLFLAQKGFRVEGVDISAEAVIEVLKTAQEKGVMIKTAVADLEVDFLIEKNAYDLIICFNYLQRSLIPQIKAGLRIGGMAVYETYIVDQRRFGEPKNPNYLLGYNELLDMFRDFRCLRYREGIMDHRKAIAGIVAEKIRPTTESKLESDHACYGPAGKSA